MNIDMEQAQKRYEALPEQEKEMIREALDSPLALVLNKVLPELMQGLGQFNKPRRKMDQAMREQAVRILRG